MTDISNEKRRLLKIFAKTYCNLLDSNSCQKKPCSCAIAAEYRAFLNKTIPEGYRRFSIRDFHGKLNDKDSLNAKVAMEAKKKVLEYCWSGQNLIERLALMSDSDLDKASRMSERIKNGDNVIIHGDSKRKVKANPSLTTNRVVEVPTGRTFVASIITKEAIKMRLDAEFRYMGYEWIEFNSLVQKLTHDPENSHYETCNWLVIDDILPSVLTGSVQQKAFLQPIWDSFFLSRLREKLPTVLVFKFDINNALNELESIFGSSWTRIINNKRTCQINLTEKE